MIKIERIYIAFLIVLLLCIVTAIALNTILEIGFDVQKSPYARFIAKGANVIYDFLTDKNINISKVIICLIASFGYISFILFTLSLTGIIVYRNRIYTIKSILSFAALLVSILFYIHINNNISKIQTGASFFYLYYLSIISILFLTLGLSFYKMIPEIHIPSTRDLFSFKLFIREFSACAFIAIIFLYMSEFIYLLIRNHDSFLNWKDIVFTLTGILSVSFYILLLHISAFAIILYPIYIAFHLVNTKLFISITSLLITVSTMLILYFWGFNYINRNFPVFNVIPAISLTLILYPISTYFTAYLIFFILKNSTYKNATMLPFTIIAIGSGWFFCVPIYILASILFKNKLKVIKTVFISTLLLYLAIILRLLYYFYNEKYLSHAYIIHYFAGAYLVIVTILVSYVLFSLLNITNILKNIISLRLILVYFLISIIGYILIGIRENVRFLLIRKTNIIMSGISILREASDLDRDEFSYFFYGGDKSEFNKKDNPYFQDYFKRELNDMSTRQSDLPIRQTSVGTADTRVGATDSILPIDIKKEELFELNRNKCNINSSIKVTPILSKFNLIIITLDGLRRDMVGIYGNKEKLTPNLDNFAKDSVVFNNAYSNSSLSLVLDLIFFTGHYNIRNLERKMPYPYFIEMLCEKDMYEYYFFPPYWHLFEKCSNKKVYILNTDITSKYVALYKKWYRNSRVVFDTIIDLLDTNVSKTPLFMYITSLDTHFPFNEYWKESKFFGFDLHGIYKNHIVYQDNSFGTFIDALKKRNLYDNSIIVVFADHGSELKEHGRIYHGYHLYSESVNIPFIIKIPGVKPKTIDIPFATVDFLPTILNILGMCNETDRYDGKDFSKIILSNENPINSKLTNDLIFLMDGIEDRYGLIYKNKYKLLYNRTVNVFELYDLQDDPKEVKNIADKEKDIFEKLKYILFDFLYKGFHIYGDVSIFKKVPEQ